MKLVVIWLVGVPLTVVALCTAAALWPRGTALHAAAPVTAAHGSVRTDAHIEHVLPPVRK